MKNKSIVFWSVLWAIISFLVTTYFWLSETKLLNQPKPKIVFLLSSMSFMVALAAFVWSLISFFDSKRVKFKPKVKLELGQQNSTSIESINYQIYGYNSGNVGDAISEVTFFLDRESENRKIFSKEQILDITPVGFVNSGEINEKLNYSPFSSEAKLLVKIIIKKNSNIYFKINTYSGRIYTGYAETTVNSRPGWGIMEDQLRDGYVVKSIDGHTFLNTEYLKSEDAKSKFIKNAEAESSWSTLLPDEETAQQVLEQYILELIDGC